jgi:AcrR family transcriptional regulator
MDTGQFSSRADGEVATFGTSSRHHRLLDEAARQLNARGVSLTSLAEIAAKLGLSRAALYYYVEDRRDLVFQCYRRACEITSRHLLEASHEADAAAVLASFVIRMLDPAQSEIAARAEIAMMTPEQRGTIQGLYDALITRLADVLEAGARQGVLRKCDAQINARVVLSLVTWPLLARRWSGGLTPVASHRLLASISDTLLTGLAAGRSELPRYQAIDLSPLTARNALAIDRHAIHGAKRETLITVASRLFNRKGIDSTLLEEIAAQVGATKRTVHRHFGSKQALVMASCQRAFEIFTFIMERLRAYKGSRLEALAAAFHALACAYPREDLSPLSPLVGFDTLGEQEQARCNEQIAPLSVGYVEALRSGVAEGSMRELDIEAYVLMIPGAFSWLVKDDVATDPVQREQIAREIANLLTMGLKT